MNKKIPFYTNTPDNTHCFQAAIKILAKHFWPAEEYSWEELDKITAKAKDLWTWHMAGVLWLQKKGVEIVDIEIFDYKKFVVEKENYLLSFFGEEAGKEQIKYSDINQELDYARKFQKNISIQTRIPMMKDIKELLQNDNLLICCVNAQVLNNKKGYVGHFVVVKGYDDEGLYMHDPGLPAYENRKVDYELFEKAWAYPNEKVKNILAFKLRQ